jgi:hypothetical protein
MRTAGATKLRSSQAPVLVDGDQATSWGGFGNNLVIAAPEAPHGLTSAR